jgi:AcrR family transcriptional regulator
LVADPGPGPSLRERQRARTRQLLIDAALELFEEKGYLQTAIEDVCGAIGASRATFYLHFKSKRDVIVAKHLEGRPGFIARYEALDAIVNSRPAQLEQEVRAWLAGWLVWWQENRALLSALREASIVDPQILDELGDPTYLVDVMDLYLSSFPPAQRARARLGVSLLEVMTSHAFNWVVLDQAPLDVEQTLDFLAGLWADALLGRTPSTGDPGAATSLGKKRPPRRPPD